MYKYTFIEVSPFMFKVSKQVVINYMNNLKQKWATLSRRHVIDPTLYLKIFFKGNQ